MLVHVLVGRDRQHVWPGSSAAMAGSSCELRLNGPLGAVAVTRLSTAGDAQGASVAAAVQHANRATTESTSVSTKAVEGEFSSGPPELTEISGEGVRTRRQRCATEPCATLRPEGRTVKGFVVGSPLLPRSSPPPPPRRPGLPIRPGGHQHQPVIDFPPFCARETEAAIDGQKAQRDALMQALSCTNEVDNTPETGTLTLLYDRVRRSMELGLIKEGLDDLCGGLEHIRNGMDPGAWRAFAAGAREDRTVGDFLYQDPLTRRAFDKPRGYAGDAIMMDYIYGIHGGGEVVAQASDVGGAICRCIRHRPAGESVRYRRAHIAELIDGIAAAQPQPTVLAIASGHLREAELSTALASSRVGKFVALDVDADSLREVETQYTTLGVETVHASVRSILAQKSNWAASILSTRRDSTTTSMTRQRRR